MLTAKKILSNFATPNMLFKREFSFSGNRGDLLFNPDITDSEVIREIVRALEETGKNITSLSMLYEQVIYVSEAEIFEEKNDDGKEIISRILSGDTILFLDGFEGAIICNSRKWDKRAVTEPPNETIIRGPREGFTEDIKTNLSLIERRLKSPNLAVERMTLGRISTSNVAIVYLNNIVDKSLVGKIKNRLKSIDIDAVFDSQNLESYLDERPHSIFSQSGKTEKPDILSSKLLEGRVGIFLDGSPVALTVPFLFVEDFHSSEDYYQRNSYSTFIRVLRFVAIIFALYLPGAYVAIQLGNYDIVPLRLLVTIMNAVKGTPFPPTIEMLTVIILFEIIREASARMPRLVGTAMSIVGALVLGETAVKAGLISSPSIMITALSSMALFLVPQQIGTFSLLRILYTLIGGLLGIYGLILATVFVMHYLCNFDTYGTPYLAPFAPFIPMDMKDNLVKKPMSKFKKRPLSINNNNKTRQS